MKIHLRHIPWMTYGLLCFSAAPLTAQFQLDAETGGVFSGYNDVRVPNETGTLFSISKDLASDAKLFYRIRFSLGFSRRHTLSILFAPLTIKASGQVNRDILLPPMLVLSRCCTFDFFGNGETIWDSSRRPMLPLLHRAVLKMCWRHWS